MRWRTFWRRNEPVGLPDPERAVAVLRKASDLVILTTPRKGAAMGPILREHIRVRGLASLLPVVVPLLVVGVINVRLLRTGGYHFLTRDELCDLLGTGDVRPAYSGQGWLAVIKGRGQGCRGGGVAASGAGVAAWRRRVAAWRRRVPGCRGAGVPGWRRRVSGGGARVSSGGAAREAGPGSRPWWPPTLGFRRRPFAG